MVEQRVGGDFARFDEDHPGAFEQDDQFDEECCSFVGAVEAAAVEPSNDHQHEDAEDCADAKELVDRMVGGGAADEWPSACGVEGLDVGLEPHEGSEEEADHDQPVRCGDQWLAGEFGVQCHLFDEGGQPSAWLVEPACRGELRDVINCVFFRA